MRHKLILLAIHIVWLFVIISALSSCNVSKHITKTSIDSTSVYHKDSASSVFENNKVSIDNKSLDSNDVGIVFYPEQDSVKSYNESLQPSVIIKETDSGVIIINHSGSRIKSIAIKNTKEVEQKKDTSAVIAKIETIHYSDSSRLVKSIKTIDKTTKPGLSLFKWIGIAVAAGVVIYLACKIYLHFNPEATGVFALLAGWRRKKQV